MIYFFIGFFSGIITGMGIGGGSILIPALVLFTPLTQQQAQGINLIVFIPAAIAALIIHHKNKNIEYKITIPIILSGILSSIIGSLLAVNISAGILKRIFGFFLILIGLLELFGKRIKKPSRNLRKFQ